MIDRVGQLRILIESNRRSLATIHSSFEEFESGLETRGTFSALRRAFHTIKSDSAHLGLPKLAAIASHCETIIDHALDAGLGLPLEILREAEGEIRLANETLAKGGRHEVNRRLERRLEEAATRRAVD